jgi:hypothetical protein
VRMKAKSWATDKTEEKMREEIEERGDISTV